MRRKGIPGSRVELGTILIKIKKNEKKSLILKGIRKSWSQGKTPPR